MDLPTPEALEHLDGQPQPTGITVANASGRRRIAESGSDQDAKLNFSMIMVHTPAPSLLPSRTSFWLACLPYAPCLPAGMSRLYAASSKQYAWLLCLIQCWHAFLFVAAHACVAACQSCVWQFCCMWLLCQLVDHCCACLGSQFDVVCAPLQRMAHQVATSQERLAQAGSLLLQAQQQSDFFAQHLLVLVLLRASRQAAAQGNSAPAIALLRGLQGMWSRMEVGPPQSWPLLASTSNLCTKPQC